MFVLCACLGVSHGSEWLTSGGYHCTEKCKTGERGDIEEVFWCPVVDGLSLEHVGGKDKLKWDYCTPAQTGKISENIKSNKRQSGNFNPGNNVNVPSSLPGVDCSGPCTKQSNESMQCNIPLDEMQSFYCSPKTPLERKQISSQNKLWCTGPCIKNPGDDYYECKTMFGLDRCSPTADRSATGEKCYTWCEKEEHHYKCHTDDKLTKLDDCGQWNHPKAGMESLEYTLDNEVCASPCQDWEGYGNIVCSYVEWEWQNDLNMAELKLKMGSCNGANWIVFDVMYVLLSSLLLLIVL